MPNNGFLRGLIVVLCAQIPLLIFFFYLLYLGVGISEFSNLADERHPDPEDLASVAIQGDERLKKQIAAEVARLSLSIEQVQQAQEALSDSSRAWQNFSSQGGLQAFARIQDRLVAIDADLESAGDALAARVTDLEGAMSSVDRRLRQVATETSDTSRQLAELRQSNIALTRQKAALQQAVSDLTRQGVAVEKKESSLAGQNTALQRSVASLAGQKAALEKQVSDLAGQGAALKQSLSALHETVARLDRQTGAMADQLAAEDQRLSRDVSRLDQSVDRLGGQMAAELARPPAPSENQQPPVLDELLKQHAALFAPRPKRKPAAQVHFDANDWQLDLSSNQALNELISRVRKSDKRLNIGIYGFTGKNGPLNFTMALADKRARVVADLMRDAGVTENPITIFVVPEYTAYRDDKSGDESGSGQRARDQAVHIYLDEK